MDEHFDASDPIRVNLDFMIGLRNRIAAGDYGRRLRRIGAT
jgi:hypothetical protein